MSVLEYAKSPSPHAFIPQLIDPELFAKIKFPDIPERPGGRIGRDLYPGEPGWAELMETPGWKELSSTFMDPKFIQSVVDMFADDIRAQGGAIDPAKIYYEPYQENRRETETAVSSATHDPNSIFARFDVQAIGKGYGKGVHCDWPRRIFGAVLFITGAEDEGLTGGEFALYSDQDFHNDRRCHKPKIEKVFPIVKNSGVIFLNSNTGFHGPLPIKEIKGLRRWIYYSISSRRDVWARGVKLAA